MESNVEPGRVVMINTLALEDLQQTNKRQAAEIKRLEELVEGRDNEIDRLTGAWNESLDEVERLQVALSGHHDGFAVPTTDDPPCVPVQVPTEDACP